MKKQFIFILLLNFAFGQTDFLWTEVSGDTVTIHHDNTERNCGVLFNFSVTFLDSNIIEVIEVDTGGVADCFCEFDLELTIGGLSAGTWTAGIYGQDLEGNGESEYYGSVEFTIDVQGGTGIDVVNEYQSPCNPSSDFLDYFPLEVENEWSYQITHDYDIFFFTQTITNTEENTTGNLFYEFDYVDFSSWLSSSNYFRWDGSWVWGWFGPYYDTIEHNGTDSLHFPMFKFDAELNVPWEVTFMSSMDSVDFFMVPMILISNTDTVITGVGTFYDCYHFTVNFLYGDITSFWFAEGVGLVKRYDFHEGSPNVEWVLQSTNVLSTRHNDVLPNKINLYQPYPNPFNPVTTIRFLLQTNSHAYLQIFDITGRLVETLVNGELVSGEHEITWNAGNLPSGVYFVRLISGDFSQTKKIILMK